MKYTQSAGGVALNKDSQVLVVDQGDSWSLPKGHIEDGEDKLSAAKREIYEESGISELKLVKEFPGYQRTMIGNDDEIKTVFIFLFTTPQLKLKPLDNHHPEARWVEIEEVASILTHTKDKEFFQSVKDEVRLKSENIQNLSGQFVGVSRTHD